MHWGTQTLASPVHGFGITRAAKVVWTANFVISVPGVNSKRGKHVRENWRQYHVTWSIELVQGIGETLHRHCIGCIGMLWFVQVNLKIPWKYHENISSSHPCSCWHDRFTFCRGDESKAWEEVPCETAQSEDTNSHHLTSFSHIHTYSHVIHRDFIIFINLHEGLSGYQAITCAQRFESAQEIWQDFSDFSGLSSLNPFSQQCGFWISPQFTCAI